ncbi:hypothetical protein XENOCAPTIV_009557 [Xenoophorus captivus]|uniref:G-protein coupled receptors family 1 profile domain-containing protein n=1 Tax=Xenoophorus captivus TaxID=1517983 RepID=A0ABV0R3S4_9TELE
METLAVFGLILHCSAIYTCTTTIMVLGYYCICIGSSAQTFFHCLTCVERYLAVVHPIIYMKLKRSHGVRIRNICIVLAWLLSFETAGFVAMFFPIFPIAVYFSIFSFIIIIVCFCSLAVFCVLICSGMRRDRTKWRAFHTIVAITGTLVLRFYGQISLTILFSSAQVKEFHSSVMLINSSSNISPSSPPACSFNTSLYPVVFSCFSDTKHNIYLHLYTLINLLIILPLYLFILWMGFQRWRYHSSQTSHTDVFTYYMAAVEILTVFGLFSYCSAIYTCITTIMVFGYCCACTVSTAQTFFHCLTCVERYLAVVHPIIYMKLKSSYGVRIRNICIVLAWLLSLGSGGLLAMFFPIFPISVYFSIYVFIILIMCFCSLAVFCVLMCSGMRRDQTKWRAFHTIVAITGTLVLRFYGQIVFMLIFNSIPGMQLYYCEIYFSGTWLCLPSNLVIPLLFLHRNGKLTCHKRNLV